MRKPRLTDKVIEGIIAATSAHLAGDVESAFGSDNEDTRRDWGAMVAADLWARQMRDYREQKKPHSTK